MKSIFFREEFQDLVVMHVVIFEEDLKVLLLFFPNLQIAKQIVEKAVMTAQKSAYLATSKSPRIKFSTAR